MRINLYPGTFDPITNGHMDIINRGVNFSDKLIIGVLNNPSKAPFFSVEERVEMIKEVTNGLGNIVVDSFSGLLTNYVKKNHIDAVIRGLRATTDFEYEFQMAQMNRKLYSEMETIFLMTKSEYSYISSSLVKEVFMFGGDIEDLVPAKVVDYMKIKLNNKMEGTK